MKSTGLPCPNDDLFDPKRSKIEYHYGIYHRIQFCRWCRWFNNKPENLKQLCPDCGNTNLDNVVGRFIYEIKYKRFLFINYFSHKIVDFLRRDEE